MSDTDERPLNPDKPYYTWSEYESRLGITSECCGDSFSESEERVLLAHLAKKYCYIDVAAMRSAGMKQTRAGDIWVEQALDALTTIYDPNHKGFKNGEQA